MSTTQNSVRVLVAAGVAAVGLAACGGSSSSGYERCRLSLPSYANRFSNA